MEIKLGKLKTLESPQLRLEQYPVSAKVAAEFLYLAGFEHDDLYGRNIVDLGTGTGRLAIGAALMGAKSVIGVDIDDKALDLAAENAELAQVFIEWLKTGVEKVNGKFDTAIMNPPYGTRTPHQDIRFLQQAFQLAPTIYSIHKSSTREFLIEYIKKHGMSIDDLRSVRMDIPHMFSFHKKKSKEVEVDLFRISRQTTTNSVAI